MSAHSAADGTMSESCSGDGLDAVYPQVVRTYARQARLIDTGDAEAWAATFTADGVFESPSYPAPVQGRAQLEAFARRFAEQGAADGVVNRHVITNIDVTPGVEADHVVGHMYLQIVVTPKGQPSSLVRLTTIVDQLVRASSGQWLVAHRQVLRDD